MWAELLEDKKARGWHDALAKQSKNTADENARVLHRLLTLWKLSPSDLVQEATRDAKATTDRIRTLTTEMRESGKTSSYCYNLSKVLRSFLRFHGLFLASASRWVKSAEDEDFKRWHTDLARGSINTADENARILHRLLGAWEMTPAGLVKAARKDLPALENKLLDFISDMEGKKRSGTYIKNFVKVVRSYLRFHGIVMVRAIRIKDSDRAISLEAERIPTTPELREIMNNASPRTRVIIALLAWAGVRPMVLGNRFGTDGLMLKDLPDFQIEGGSIKVTRVPAVVTVRREMSKAKHKYFTLLPAEGCQIVAAHLNARLSKGEKMDGNTPIIAVTPHFELCGKSRENRGSKFIVTRNITAQVRAAMRPRFPWRPYVLRSYFATNLMIMEGRGKISHAICQFLMGHVGDIESKYTVRKGKLPEELLETIRASFQECEPLLTGTNTEEARELDAWHQKLEMWAKASGRDPVKVVKGWDRLPKTKQLALMQEIIEERFGEVLSAPAVAPPSAPGVSANYEYRRIPFENLDNMLAGGWEFVAEIKAGEGSSFMVRRRK